MRMTAGRHWAVEAFHEVDYVPGDRAVTFEGAERYWREATQLQFLPVKVRRTTPEEDHLLTCAD
jgi:hypothetical protein